MNIQVVAFEGLSPFLFGTPSYVKTQLLDRVKFPEGTALWRGSFASSGPGCLVDFKRIVIGHSMGGASAINWCNQMKDYKVDLLLTLDPRPLHRPYIKPPNVRNAANFYQKSWWFPGYEVEGAKNTMVSIPHTQVPGLSAARIVLEQHLKG